MNELILECCGKPESQCRCDEPKPDKGRLLTSQELIDLFPNDLLLDAKIIVKYIFQRIFKAQDVKTASIKDEELREEREKLFAELGARLALKDAEHQEILDGAIHSTHLLDEQMREHQLAIKVSELPLLSAEEIDKCCDQWLANTQGTVSKKLGNTLTQAIAQAQVDKIKKWLDSGD